MKKLVCSFLILTIVLLSSLNMFTASAVQPEYDYFFDATGSMYPGDTIINKQDVLPENLIGKIQIDSNNLIRISANAADQNVGFKDLTLKGHFYLFDSGYKKDKAILGDFTIDNQDFSVIKVRIDKDIEESQLPVVSKNNKANCVITVAIKNNSTNQNYYLQSAISNKEFNEILNKAKKFQSKQFVNSLSKGKYNDKLVELDLGKIDSSPSQVAPDINQVTTTNVKKSKNSPIISDEIQSLSQYALTATTTKAVLSDFSYSDITSLITKLKESSSGINVEDYGISTSFFTSTGYQHSNQTSPVVFMAAKYTHQSLDGFYYTRLTLCPINQGGYALSNSGNFGNWETYLQMEYYKGIMICYNPNTKVASLYLDNYGLYVYDVQLAFSNLRGNTDNVFTRTKISGVVTKNNYDFKNLLALIDPTDFIVSFWSCFSNETTGYFNGGWYYHGSTAEEQVTLYDKVVRGIEMDSNKSYMINEGDRMVLTGVIRWYLYDSCNYNYGWKYWVRTSSVF